MQCGRLRPSCLIRAKNMLGELEKRIKYTKKALEVCRRRGISKDCVAREEILKYQLDKSENKKLLY